MYRCHHSCIQHNHHNINTYVLAQTPLHHHTCEDITITLPHMYWHKQHYIITHVKTSSPHRHICIGTNTITSSHIATYVLAQTTLHHHTCEDISHYMCWHKHHYISTHVKTSSSHHYICIGTNTITMSLITHM